MRLKTRAGRIALTHIIAMLLVMADATAQDPHFSQFFANPLYTNPAFAGSTHHARVVTNTRNQWSSIAGTFTTISAAFDEHYDILNGGIGIMLTRDQAGIGLLTTNTISGLYSYQINVNKYVTVRASLQASLVQKTIDFGNFTWGDQILRNQGIVKPVTGESIDQNAIFFPNFASGIIVYTSQFYGGVAIHNLLQPSQGFWSETKDSSIISRRYTGHLGLQIPIRKSKIAKNNISISPNVLYMQQGPFTEINLGMYYNKGSYILGSYFRQTTANADALIFLIGLRREKLRIGYSYDATISNARPGARGSHEVSLAFELRKRQPKSRVRAIRCPEF
ncbi:MAG: type IX secretion system membrane protein PorP/SprF [Bacteroidia bacterium]|jgi:type IX secretion system PorP/SprF family membrane protein|nr:type IX secretion system membrane protein PorP/SprF [Bacteroidia bacterium]